MALKKGTKKLIAFVLLPVALVAAVWFLFIRTRRDKYGNTFKLNPAITNGSGSQVLINGTATNNGYLVSLKNFTDGTVGGVNKEGKYFYWNNADWVLRAA